MIGNRAAVSRYANADGEKRHVMPNSNALHLSITAVTLDVLAFYLPFWILA